MIDPKALTEKDKGKLVRYTAGHGETETGIISSWNSKNIFVRYKANTWGTATSPEDLEFVTKTKVSVTVHQNGRIFSQQHYELDVGSPDTDVLMANLAKEHALLQPPSYVEICFLDEPDPNQRYFRIGSDPRHMVLPMAFRASHKL